MFHVGGFEDLEAAHECFVDAHHGAGVVELAAIIGCAEHCDKLSFGKELIAVLDHLLELS